jgi:hypothetical protein
LVVKYMTYSPVGARDTVGSCAKTGITTALRVNDPGRDGSSATACTICELVSQALMPVP